MKVKLLRKLRQEIIRNSDICHISRWSAYLTTILDGVKYKGPSHATIYFMLQPEKAGTEIEHIALKGYIERRKEAKNDQQH